MRIYFIRHAQSSNNLLWHLHGSESENLRHEDPDLTDIGRQQAVKLAEFLKYHSPNGNQANEADTNFEITHIYTSLMVRAVATGTIIAKELDLPLVAMENLHEVGGVFIIDPDTGDRIGGDGMNRKFFETHYPSLILPETLDMQGWWKKRPIEPKEFMLPRAKAVINDILSKHQSNEDKIALISHGTFYQAFICALLGIPLLINNWMEMNNAAITRIDINTDHRILAYSNKTCHLPSNLITS